MLGGKVSKKSTDDTAMLEKMLMIVPAASDNELDCTAEVSPPQEGL